MSVPTRTPLRAEPLASGGTEALPEDRAPRRLLRRLLQVVALVVVLVLVVLLALGLGEVRERLGDAAPGWLAVAVALEALSFGSYLLMFKLEHATPGFVAELLAALTVRYPTVPISFCETRSLAEEWTYRFLGAALAYAQAQTDAPATT